MKRKHTKAAAAKDKETPAGPSIYRHDPTTDLWKGEDGKLYRLDTRGTKPAHLDLTEVKA